MTPRDDVTDERTTLDELGFDPLPCYREGPTTSVLSTAEQWR